MLQQTWYPRVKMNGINDHLESYQKVNIIHLIVVILIVNQNRCDELNALIYV